MTTKKIALFVGSDVVAHHEMCGVVEDMIEKGLEPVLFYPRHAKSTNSNAKLETFQDYAFVERLILQDVVFPFLRANPDIQGPSQTPEDVCAKYNLRPPFYVEKINDPEFYNEVANIPGLVGSISLRCTQMFGQGITKTLKENGRFLLNLHSGILPDFRGLYSTPRAIAEVLRGKRSARGEFGVTLHHVDPYNFVKGDLSKRYAGIDTGNIVELWPTKLDPAKTVYATNIELSKLGVEAVKSALNKYKNAVSLSGHPQDNTHGHYYSFAGPREIGDWKRLGLRMFDYEEVIQILTQAFSTPDTEGARALEKTIRDAMATRFGVLNFEPKSGMDGKSIEQLFGGVAANDSRKAPTRTAILNKTSGLRMVLPAL